MTIVERIEAIQKSIEEASAGWEHTPEIIAVTKTVSADRINEVLGSSIRRIGENRAQEILEKYGNVDSRLKFDFIGRLQINKVRNIIDKVSQIQSLDRMELAEEIDRRAKQRNLRMPVLLQINIGNEPQKGGISPDTLFPFIRQCAALTGLHVKGLMCVMPNAENKEELIPLFQQMRDLFEKARLEAVAGTDISELSMGMSEDYLYAVRAGATHVRIGSAIFGERFY